MIIVVSRYQNGITNYDTELLRDFYKVGVRNPQQFKQGIYLVLAECPDTASKLKFDIMMRRYDEEGQEMIPPPILKQLQEEGAKMQ